MRVADCTSCLCPLSCASNVHQQAIVAKALNSHLTLSDEEEDTADSKPQPQTKQEMFKQAVRTADKPAAESAPAEVCVILTAAWLPCQAVVQKTTAPL